MAIMTSSTRRTGDHFEPNDVDPQVQRRLRGYLEQIDYTAFASNKAVLGATMGHADGERFQRLAVAAATARAKWVAEASAMADAGATLSEAQVTRLAHLRTAYEELSAAYEATRRMVERGYVTYRPIQG
jgi:acetyl-CoA carboxylase beta subunit